MILVCPESNIFLIVLSNLSAEEWQGSEVEAQKTEELFPAAAWKVVLKSSYGHIITIYDSDLILM